MITKVHIKNIHAIKESTINFEKSRYHYLCENIYNEKLVNPIAFYGTNGSGKTSFIATISQLSQILWKEPGNYTVFIPNLFDEKNKNSELKIWFELESVEYVYEIITNLHDGILQEKLVIKEEVIFYKKDNLNYYYNNKEHQLNSPIFSVLRRIASDLVDDRVVKAYNYLSNISYVDASKQQFLCKKIEQKTIQDVMVEQSNEVKKILSDYKCFPTYDFKKVILQTGGKEYYISMNIKGKDKLLHNSFMSTGMYNQSVMLSILTALPENSVLVIDEIEDALHPITIMDFIHAVQKRGIQLIFTSHNTYILQKLRPDQIFFANWNNGFSNYRKLSDIYPNIREINNIEKMYLSHMFDDDITKDE